MTVPKVWTERNIGSTGWTDCTWCSILMVVVGSGFSKFPLGIYTQAERVAFRGGDPRLNFSGGVDRALARYGVRVISPTPFSQAGLRAALNIPGRVYAVAGQLSNFPAGHPLRRWQPSFAGTHAIAITTLGNGKVTWLDPLAPNLYAGDAATVADVVDTFARGHYPNDARYLPQGADMTIIVNATMFLGPDGKPAPRQVSFAGGVTVTGYALDGTSEKFTAGAGGSWAPADARCAISGRPDAPVGQPFVRIIAGVFQDHPYLLETQPGLTVAPDPTPTPPPNPTPTPDPEAAALAAHNAAADVATQAGIPLVGRYALEKYPKP